MADRISTLTDDLLCHILSFLPTKIAVTTSVLSKRWKSLYLSVPTICLDEEDVSVEDEDSFPRFAQFVDAVIESRDQQQPIKIFHLMCWSHLFGSSNVTKWVETAIQRKVEDLKLHVPFGLILPPSILTCKTLVVLKLRDFVVKDVVSFGLPALKILHLSGLVFEEGRCFIELLNGCPILEDLKTKHLALRNGHLKGELKCLPKVVRAKICNDDVLLQAIYNVEFLRLDRVNGTYAVRPHFHKYKGIPVFQNLIHMEVSFVQYSNWHWVVEMLNHCPKLQILVIDKRDFDETEDQNWECLQLVPECLQFHLKTFSFKDYEGLEGEFLFVRYIMENARVLQTMKVCSSFSDDSTERLETFGELFICPRGSPACELLFE